MTEYLSPAELHTLTGFARSAQQAGWLKKHMLPHQADGKRIIVSREHIRAWLEGKDVKSSTGPNWAAVA